MGHRKAISYKTVVPGYNKYGTRTKILSQHKNIISAIKRGAHTSILFPL